jgi:photosystem II stability/assembly factor-like uncharacterized protein
MLMRTAGRAGTIPAGAWAKARAQALAAGRRTAAAAPSLASAKWQLQGPTAIGGRVLDIVVDPLRKDAIYLAAASGGVWHSTDAGTTFTSVWPDDLVQTIGALAITPDGTLYAGTGEAGPGGGSLTYGGTGVYRSTDGGKHWQNIGLTHSERIGRIAIDPTNPKRIFVAANGPLFTTGGERGLYRTLDGGDHWTKVLTGSTPSSGAVDVAIDPVDPKRVFTTMWDRLRRPGQRDYTGGGSGLYRSTDGGDHWSNVGTPLFGPGLMTVGRLGVAIAPTDHNRVYVLSSTVDGLTGGFYISTDGGTTFIPRSFDPNLVTGGFVYAWWFGRVYVDPKNADHVFATGVNLSRSTDAGVTFESPGGVHADQHAMAWDLREPGRVYLGNDGGAYRSDDNGATYEHGEYMPWNQPFSVDVSQQRPDHIVGGLQDNGGNRSWTAADDDVGPDVWNDITGGDGTEMRINPVNDKIVYGCSQYGACAVSTDGGNSMSAFDTQIIGDRKNWLSPIVFDPIRPSTVYTASSIVHRSRDNGQNWEVISPDLTDGEAGSAETNPLFRNYDTVTTIAPTNEDTGTIIVGTDDGHIAYTHDNAATWTRATDPDLPKDWVSRVRIDPHHNDIAYAAFSGFRSGNNAASVFRSADKGVGWTNISGDLPHAPLNDLLVLGDDLYAATDVGVFVTYDVAHRGGKHWLRVGAALPMTPVWSLAWHAASKTLFAADFGRGVYAVKLAGLTHGETNPPPQDPTGSLPGGSAGGGGAGNGGGGLAATGLPVTIPTAGLLGTLLAALAVRRRTRPTR